jgi:opacity protein-like surface antigen
MNTGWAETRLDYHFLGLNGKLFFPLAVFHPYVTAGIGYYTADITAVDEDTSRGFNLGAGMEIHLGSTWAICGEGRYNHVNLVLDEVDTEVRDFTFTGSVHFYF